MKNGSEVEKAKWKEIQYLFLIEIKQIRYHTFASVYA